MYGEQMRVLSPKSLCIIHMRQVVNIYIANSNHHPTKKDYGGIIQQTKIDIYLLWCHCRVLEPEIFRLLTTRHLPGPPVDIITKG